MTITAESLPALKEGAMKIFKRMMEDLGHWNDDCWNATDRIYRFPKGGKVQFKSYDTIGKARMGKRTHLFINECQFVPFPIVEELMTRSYEQIWFDYNPNNPFYIQDEILPRDDAELIVLTYKDNEATPPRLVKDFERKANKAFIDPEGDWDDPDNIMSHYHSNWCNVYIRGKLGSLEGIIFNDWSQVDAIDGNAELLGYGMDFGYTNDPTAWVAIYRLDELIIYDELIYQRGLSASSIANKMRDHEDEWTYADSSDPRLIDELYDLGIKIRGVKKGPGSVNFGITLMQDHNFAVTSRSLNLIKELREYSWDTDKQGQLIQSAIDENNHAIDAARYGSMELLATHSVGSSGGITTVRF